jgi:putative oxidoreductase
MDRLLTAAVPALGRLMLAVIFIGGGLGKISAPDATIGYIAAHGLPLPPVAYVLSIIVELGGGIAILIGLQTRAVAAVMAVFCLITAVMFHYVPDDRNMMINFMKNIALAGGFLQLVAWGAGRWSADALLSRRRVAVRPASV